MCVLTYIPTENNGFILTSNRDEAVSREPAIPPRKYHLHGQNVFFPKDPKGGGTWIASSGKITLCLLNGGVAKHIPQPPYRHSRGKIIIDFFTYNCLENFVANYDFSGIEPFTLVVINSNNGVKINELRWDGTQIFTKEIDKTKPQIWSSVTLYSPQVIAMREQWFTDFLEQPINPENVLNFHQNGGNGDEQNAIRVNRNNVLKTISTTQFVINNKAFSIYYEDLLVQRKYNFRVIA